MQVIVKTTTQCNLACTYCSEGNQPPRTLSLSTFCKLIDELPPVLERAGQHDINILGMEVSHSSGGLIDWKLA